MVRQREFGKMISTKTGFSNEKGAVLLTTVIFLLLLSLIGIRGINTASTDLQITRNYRIHKENLVLADAALNKATIMVKNNLPGDAISSFLQERLDDEELDGFYDISELWDNGNNKKYFKEEEDWNQILMPVLGEIDANAIAEDFGSDPISPVTLSDNETDTEYVVYVCAQGSDDKVNGTRGDAVIIARSAKKGGEVVLEVGVEGER